LYFGSILLVLRDIIALLPDATNIIFKRRHHDATTHTSTTHHLYIFFVKHISTTPASVKKFTLHHLLGTRRY
jgi:hypothetical protein